MAAPRRRLNPDLLDCVQRSGKNKSRLAIIAGYPHYTTLFITLRALEIGATPLAVRRLERLAYALDFPPDQIFLDEVRA